jgi:SAM-dependent methyltransferase
VSTPAPAGREPRPAAAAAPPPPAAGPAELAALRDDLRAAPFTVAALEVALGPVATAALRRDEAVAARRALRGSGEPLAVLARLFLLGVRVPRSALDNALPRLGANGAVRCGLVRVAGAGEQDEVRAVVDLAPSSAEDAHGPVDLWFASDVSELASGAPLRPDHVLGVGGASVTLVGLTVRDPVDRALDLGTGCGVQALHLVRHAGAVVATDTSARALAFARFNAGLAEADVDLRAGSMLGPVAGEELGLVVSNPPFVITPRGPGDEPARRYTYRDGGGAGDDVVRHLVTRVGEILAPGGVAQILGNWEHRRGEGWRERVAAWLAASGLDGWAVQRDVADPAEYAETWLRDGGLTPDRDPARWRSQYEAWLTDFEARGVEAVGFGYVTLRRPRRGAPTLRRVEENAGPLTGPLGPHVAAALAAHDWLAGRDDAALAGARLLLAADVTEERHYVPGAQDPSIVLLHQGGGFARTVRAGTALAGLAGACDGELTVGQIVGGLATLLDVPAGALAAEVLPQVRALVADGLLRPAP